MNPNAFAPGISSVFTSTANTLANITGLSMPVQAGGTYRFSAYGAWSGSLTTTTLGLFLTFPASPTLLNYRMSMANAAGGGQVQLNYSETGTAAASSAAAVINTRYPWEIIGCIRPSVSGTIQVQAKNPAASGTLTIPAGAVLLMTQEA